MLTPINDMSSRSRSIVPGQLAVQTPQKMLQEAEQYIAEADGYKKSGQVDEAEKLYQAAQKLFEEEGEKLSLEPQSGKIIESIYLSYGLLLNEQGRRTDAETLEQKRQQIFERYRLNNAGFSKKRTVERGASSLHLNKKNHPLAIEQLSRVDASLLSYSAKLEAFQDSSDNVQPFSFKPILTDSAGTNYVGVETLVQSCHGTINAPVHGKNNTVNVHYYPPNLEAKRSHAVSLDSLRNALYQHYQLSNLSIQRVSGETASLKDCYINLAIVESQAQREKDKEGLKKQAATFERLPSSEQQQLEATNPNKLIALEKLFESQELRNGSEGIPKRILIQGRAGIGKTTLCKKVVHEYHHHGLWQDRFDSILWIPLRQLKTASPRHLEDLLCNRYFSDHGSLKAQALSKLFLEHQGKTLFILDGLDEVTEMFDQRHRLNHFLMKLLGQSHVLITSRPASVSASQCNDLDLELETIGFSVDNVQTYIQKFTPISNQTAIQQFIYRTPLIQGLVNIPIQLDALCYSWDRLPQNKEVTMSMLYEAMVDKLWRKDSVRLEKEEDGQLLGEDVIEDLSESDLAELMTAEIDYLGYLAFKGLGTEKIEFSREELSQRRKELNGSAQTGRKLPLNFTTNLKKTSYLHTLDAHRPESERQYHFLHLTFQEFFAAKFLAGHLQAYTKVEKAQTHVVQKDLGVIPQRSELEAFIATYKYNPRYEIVWWMVAGLLKGSALENFFDVLEQSPRDLIGMRHQQVMVGCLNEARTQLKATTRIQLEKEFMQWLDFEVKNGKSDYSHLGSQRGFPERLLLESLSQAEGKKKNKVMATLGARPALSDDAIRALISFLNDEEENIRSAAARALGRQSMLSSDAVQALISSLRNENGLVRYVAADVLGRQSTLSSDAVQVLISSFKDKNWAAAVVLGGQSTLPSDAVQTLISSLKDENESVRSAAAGALGRQSTLSSNVVQALLSSLKDENESVRFAAVGALGSQSTLPSNLVRALISSLKDENEQVREMAASALGNQSTLPSDVVRALISYLKDEDGEVRSAAARALCLQSTLSSDAVQILISFLKDENGFVRSAAAHALGRQRTLSADAVQVLISSLKDKDEDVRSAVARTLGSQSTLSSDAVQVLISSLKDEIWYVRSEAAGTLGRQRTLSADAVQALISSLKDNHEYVRDAAASALGSQRTLSADAAQALVSSLKDENRNVRDAAASALGSQSMLSSEAVQTLISSLKDEDRSVRFAAFRALGSHMNQLFTVLARLERNQVEELYTRFFFPRSREQIMPLYIQDHQLHFYTATGPGQPIDLTTEQSAVIIKALRSVRAEAGIAPFPEEEPFLIEE
ncbi:PBS lyase HEAT domain protein repeat-containing protein [Mycoavidus cysteinexigens]|uniref:PBS lyase HEAT domain protein repeat-containing protein n=1 Tax=Mycoavidus cysteinexigens TaxID=1553431 RepID=A0A2Z6EUH0_9BURK|nr:HEAT repeat domain-containing protein [Mycoavidus cysteinexigens]BBE08725.1 PBS lyase HEAT domain protein repeat-containing protein [Mycoavidus cysteinexigens]GAM52561.1 hypothetical protein EBME_1024 [bacterium endosymbiont of Mortierella elongata FMR23-6]GLR01547.1 hypothetical protein GCM10007934_13590 [Mycoavidus cysteinexigens]